jgi:uncharacterized phage-associated protein
MTPYMKGQFGNAPMAHSTLAIANEFLSRARRDGRPLTQMHLQKLVYLAHGWNLAVNGEPLIEDRFEAWEYGPVLRRLYDATRAYGARDIPSLLRWGQDTPFPFDDGGIAEEPLTQAEINVIDEVWRLYGHFPAFKLSALTHAPDSPWSAAFAQGRNQQISNTEISDYFVRLSDHAAA